jgi:hypothetical protein
METSPKAKRDLCRAALQVLEWELGYNVLDSLQAPFDYVLWLIEQAKARLQDRLANEGSNQ